MFPQWDMVSPDGLLAIHSHYRSPNHSEMDTPHVDIPKEIVVRWNTNILHLHFAHLCLLFYVANQLVIHQISFLRGKTMQAYGCWPHHGTTWLWWSRLSWIKTPLQMSRCLVGGLRWCGISCKYATILLLFLDASSGRQHRWQQTNCWNSCGWRWILCGYIPELVNRRWGRHLIIQVKSTSSLHYELFIVSILFSFWNTILVYLQFI